MTRRDGWVTTSAGRHLRGRTSRETEPELMLRRQLHASGARFRLHRQLAPACRPDIVLPRHQLAVFVDGCFWHGCPLHGTLTFSGPNATLWREKLARNQARDRSASAVAERLGWTVVRVWECAVRSDPSAAAMHVMSHSVAATKPRVVHVVADHR